ncbi:MAG: hypothetical protein KDD22_06595 [Bdellovibrionales bacterium]|nr:hypothetical protein [Bdellovibrionales bacterium]
MKIQLEFRGFCFCFVLLVLAFSFRGALGASLTESFSSNLSTSLVDDLVLNSVEGKLHPPLFIKGYTGSTADGFRFSVGNGSDGNFIESRYAEFSTNGDLSGNIIRVNTNTTPQLQFQNFTLASGWTLKPEGSNPLVIRALGTVVIEGRIDCSGDAGGSLIATSSTAVTGGTARCGGGNGGNGATAAIPATSGSLGGTIIVGGAGGGVDGPTAGGGATHGGVGAGGGGGGGYQARGIGFQNSAAGTNGGGTGGVRGEMAADHAFTVSGGGSGGGGGDYSATSNGGGGGAGGGIIEIYAVGNIDVASTGEMYANGGVGGGGGSGFTAGGGGGGGGGSIMMISGGDVRLAGPVRANKANGGSDAGPTGGQGADGRTWLLGQGGISIALPGYAINVENPYTQLAVEGNVRYRTDKTFTYTTSIHDSFTSKPTINSVVPIQNLPTGSQIQLEWTSSDTSSFTPSSWNSFNSAQIGQRYLKFRIQLTNTDETSPATLDAMSVNYDPYRQQDFQFSGGCGRVITSANSSAIFILLMLLAIPLICAVGLRFKKV